jgi:hypothetical protein
MHVPSLCKDIYIHAPEVHCHRFWAARTNLMCMPACSTAKGSACHVTEICGIWYSQHPSKEYGVESKANTGAGVTLLFLAHVGGRFSWVKLAKDMRRDAICEDMPHKKCCKIDSGRKETKSVSISSSFCVEMRKSKRFAEHVKT